MTPTEFKEKYKLYSLGEHPGFTGKEIKQDVLSLLSETDGFAFEDEEGWIHVPDDSDGFIFTKESIEYFKVNFMDNEFPISNNKLYYLDMVGRHEDVLIAKKKD